MKGGVVSLVDRPTARGQAARTAAFAGLVDRHALDSAYRYATLMLGNRSEAEDATHDAALMAWRRFGELRDPARFEAWFGRILVNACRDRLRARRRAPLSLDGEPSMLTVWTTRAAPDQADAFVRRDAIAAALRSLTADHREVVVLRFYFDLTVDQIATRTGVGAGTVKSRLHYALRQLRSAVDPSFEGSPAR
ncbi:MAG TPA: sigma-70 family RNA polymerase sigma factor [Candidatus Limnocylindrales bacterium]